MVEYTDATETQMCHFFVPLSTDVYLLSGVKNQSDVSSNFKVCPVKSCALIVGENNALCVLSASHC